jgi:hypothetical protein
MRYFSDLSAQVRQPLRTVPAERVARGGLKGLDSFVVADKVWPRDSHGKRIPTRPRLKAIKRFVKRGGNLVLTDGALKMLGKLGVVPRSAIARAELGAGHIDIEKWGDYYINGVHDTASQTYYEVALGYSVADDTSPHWTVDRTVWEDAGGRTVATVGEDTKVALGRIRFGRGHIGILGAILPRATEAYDHLFGLADYAVTVAGGKILNNMLDYGRVKTATLVPSR